MSNNSQDQTSNPRKLGKTNTFECSDISKKISKNLEALHESREFFDLILIGNDGIRIQTHRVILCCSAPYFQEYFENMPKTTKKPFEIEVNEFEGSILELVLQFIYIGTVDFQLETVRKVLEAADHYKIQPLMDLCFDFIKQKLNKNNCLDTTLFAKEHNYHEQLYEECFSFACNHFEEICFGIDFLNLDGQMVDDILSGNEVVVSAEEKIVQSLLKWLEHDRENREVTWKNRLLNVRYQFLNHNFILENTNALCTNLECHKLISCWLQWHVLPKNRNENSNARKGYKAVKIVLPNRYYLNDYLIYQIYYPEFNTWNLKCIKSLWENLYAVRPIVYNQQIIIAGGVEKDGKRTNEVKYFNFETQKRGLLPSMKRSRASAETALLNGYLYIIGGNDVVEDKLKNLLSVERYNLLERKWEDVASLLSPLYLSETAALNDCLYVVSQHKTQCYSAKDNVWSFKAHKRVNCNHFSLVSCGGYLFTVGGRLPNCKVSNSVERYNPLSDTWDVITSLRSPRDQSMCFALENSFVVVGGTVDCVWIDIVEEFNIATNEWKTLAPLLSTTLSAMFLT